MKNRSLVVLMPLAAVALCMATRVATAREPVLYQGTFSLTTETRWGQATLPAGDYSFTLDSESVTGIVEVHGQSQSALIMLQATEPTSSTSASVLRLARSNGSARILSMHLAELGKDFYFAVPKHERQILALGPQLIQRVPIAATGR